MTKYNKNTLTKINFVKINFIDKQDQLYVLESTNNSFHDEIGQMDKPLDRLTDGLTIGQTISQTDGLNMGQTIGQAPRWTNRWTR